jgi:hypothetical protein
VEFDWGYFLARQIVSEKMSVVGQGSQAERPVLAQSPPSRGILFYL